MPNMCNKIYTNLNYNIRIYHFCVSHYNDKIRHQHVDYVNTMTDYNTILHGHGITMSIYDII